MQRDGHAEELALRVNYSSSKWIVIRKSAGVKACRPASRCSPSTHAFGKSRSKILLGIRLDAITIRGGRPSLYEVGGHRYLVGWRMQEKQHDSIRKVGSFRLSTGTIPIWALIHSSRPGEILLRVCTGGSHTKHPHAISGRT